MRLMLISIVGESSTTSIDFMSSRPGWWYSEAQPATRAGTAAPAYGGAAGGRAAGPGARRYAGACNRAGRWRRCRRHRAPAGPPPRLQPGRILPDAACVPRCVSSRHQLPWIENEQDAAVAQQGRSRVAARAGEHAIERLEDDFHVLAEAATTRP